MEKLKAQAAIRKSLKRLSGQLERREYYQSDDIKWLYGKGNWIGIKTIGIVETALQSMTLYSIFENIKDITIS